MHFVLVKKTVLQNVLNVNQVHQPRWLMECAQRIVVRMIIVDQTVRISKVVLIAPVVKLVNAYFNRHAHSIRFVFFFSARFYA